MTSSEITTHPQLDFQTDREATLKLIDWFDIKRVHAARILVVGAGAIGNEVLKNLALLGLGNIYILDRDSIEMSNLSRSILFRAADAGQPKAPTAARAISEINPNVAAWGQVGDFRFDIGLGTLRRMDVIIGCLDNDETRFLLNRACRKVSRPWIEAGIEVLTGHVQVFGSSEGPCYECSFSNADYQRLPQTLPCSLLAERNVRAGRIPTTPTIASIVAGVMAQEALKLLDVDRWHGRTLIGRYFSFDGRVGDVGIDYLPERDACPAHSALDPDLIVELPNATAKRTTVAQLLEEARARLGPTATLQLNFELAVEMKCPKCGRVKHLHVPLAKISRGQLTCECEWKCNYESDLIITHTIGGNFSGCMDTLLELTLDKIGVPEMDILETRGPFGKVLYLELTGDAEAVFGN